MGDSTDYLGPEAQARVDIDRQLVACGWVVQRSRKMNLGAGPGVAVREFPMAEGHVDADYLLFVDRKAVGVIEAKEKGSTLTGVEWQSAKYTTGLPTPSRRSRGRPSDVMMAAVRPHRRTCRRRG